MKIKTYLLALALLFLGCSSMMAQAVDYSNDKAYQTLYDAMHRTFNAGDTTKFSQPSRPYSNTCSIKKTFTATTRSAATRSCSR